MKHIGAFHSVYSLTFTGNLVGFFCFSFTRSKVMLGESFGALVLAPATAVETVARCISEGLKTDTGIQIRSSDTHGTTRGDRQHGGQHDPAL